MKVILTGSTGFIGAEVLRQCISNPSINQIIALSRHPLSASHPKLTQITHSDFTDYPPSLLAQLAGADACIWSLGIANPKTMEQASLVNMDYTMAAARTCQGVLASQAKKPFRFVYLSGKYTEKNQDASLWFLGEPRKLRGRVELELLKLSEESKTKDGKFEVFIARPGFVVAKEKRMADYLVAGVANTIPVDLLARAMVGIVEHGGDGKVIWEMNDLVEGGREGEREHKNPNRV